VIVEVEVDWELKQVVQGLIREARARRLCRNQVSMGFLVVRCSNAKREEV
jgi:hypothetical protein